MAELIAPLPRATLVSGMTIAFEAIDPTTGAAVSGVKVSNVAVYADAADASTDTSETINVELPGGTPFFSPTPASVT